MLIIKYFALLLALFQSVISETSSDNVNCTKKEFTEQRETSRVLSRRKRFLIFPDGSSLQLVFCVQSAAVIPIGDIFLYGNTAALAWSLPADPMLFDYLKERERTQRRGDTINKIGYLDEKGHVLATVPYKRRPIVNPAFAKRSVDEDKISFKEKLKLKIDAMKMHNRNSQRDHLKQQNLDEKSIEFHRSSRVELFGKIERLLTALGKDGRQCVLYKLCEAAQQSDQGTFMEEFLRVVFTLPKGIEFEDEYQREYDQAHSQTNDCILKYPGCDNYEVPAQL